MIETSKAHARGRIFHVHYTAFAHNPLETIAALYRHFDLELTEDVRERMRAHLAAASPGSHHYSMEEFELDPAQLRDRFGAYVEHFGIRRESAIWQSPGNPRVPIAA
jgi:hypothetical protein